MVTPGEFLVTGLEADLQVRRDEFALDLNLQVAPGTVLALMGPNGAGKTTALRAIAGLTPLHGGAIRVNGECWDDPATATFTAAHRRRVGMVFQDYRLFEHLSVIDNVAFSARAHGAPRGPARRAASTVIDQWGLAPLADHKPAMLSGGQAQRVALARALASQPAVLLFDEPMAALDAVRRTQLRAELRTHLSGFDGPAIVVTHDALDALSLADSIAIVENGRLIQRGTPAEVARRPGSRYVAQLMGLNWYAGVWADPSTGQVDVDGGGRLFAVADPDQPLTAGQQVHVSISPAAISIHRDPGQAGSARMQWSGVIESTELVADRVRVAVRGAPPALVDVTPAAVADLGLQAGTDVWLTAKATAAVAYPRS